MKIIIAGRTGSGKTKLAEFICELGNLKLLKTYTTRPRRINEGETYHFISQSDADACRDKLFPTKLAIYEYFTKLSDWRSANVVILEPEGIDDFSRQIPDEPFILINVSATLTARITAAKNRIATAINGIDEAEMARFEHRAHAEDARFSIFETKFHTDPRQHWNNCVAGLSFHNTFETEDAKDFAAMIIQCRLDITALNKEAESL